ncbi:fimbrial protein, partial [uncultured Vibrio sp.]|uniref:fimbrial protein n=1 Tax=uncultured Vibrio sp. TaxID=114054 RepID=UPI0026259A6D
MKFIKLGYIEPGPITGDTIGLFYIHDHMNPGSMRYGSVGLNYIGTTILSSGTCTPTLTNQSVAMDIATFDSLANVGDVAGTTPFEIDMFCDGNPNVAIRFDGIADPNVVDNTVLLSTGTSDGVGLQIT